MSAWEPCGFTANTDEGPRLIAGWVKPPFALDFRVWAAGEDGYDRGWLLTHLPTGFQVLGILTPLNEACEIADRVAALMDWSFDDAAGAKGKASFLKPLKEELGDKLVFRTAAFGPLFTVLGRRKAA